MLRNDRGCGRGMAGWWSGRPGWRRLWPRRRHWPGAIADRGAAMAHRRIPVCRRSPRVTVWVAVRIAVRARLCVAGRRAERARRRRRPPVRRAGGRRARWAAVRRATSPVRTRVQRKSVRRRVAIRPDRLAVRWCVRRPLLRRWIVGVTAAIRRPQARRHLRRTACFRRGWPAVPSVISGWSERHRRCCFPRPTHCRQCIRRGCALPHPRVL
jgi:hypothetical protein